MEYLTESRCANESCLKLVEEKPELSRDESGRIEGYFRGKQYGNIYVSSSGYIYCCRECWVSYCED